MPARSRRRIAAWACTWILAAPPAARAFSTGAGTCSYPDAGWFDMGSGLAGDGGFTISFLDGTEPATRYVAGRTYTVRIENASTPYRGFLLQSVLGDPGSPGVNGVGVFSWADPDLYANGPCTVRPSSVTHTFTRARGTPQPLDTFSWTAPPAGTGTVTFHLVGVVSQYVWYGHQTRISTTIWEAVTPVSPVSWMTIKTLYR